MDIIQQLKDNERPFGLMSKEMQEKAREIGKRTNFETYCGIKSKPPWLPIIGDSEEFIEEFTYRLHPDYKEEPEIVECEIC